MVYLSIEMMRSIGSRKLMQYNIVRVFVNSLLFSHNKWYRLCEMGHEKDSDTDQHRDVESMWPELLRGSPS